MRTTELPQSKNPRLHVRYTLICCALALFAGILIIIPANTAYAADAATLDENAYGSISITMINENNERIGGGVLTAYKVAQLDKNGTVLSYSLTDEFRDCGIDVTELTADLTDTELAELAFKFETYAKDTDVTGQEMTIDSEGDAYLPQASLGLYLISQTQTAEGWAAINPFLISVPFDDGNEWIYNVDALPKIEPLSALDETQTSSEEQSTKEAETTEEEPDEEQIAELTALEEEQAAGQTPDQSTGYTPSQGTGQTSGQSTQPASLSSEETPASTGTGTKTSGTKLAQTGDDFFSWFVKNWIWLALGCVACIAVIAIILLHQRRRMSLT